MFAAFRGILYDPARAAVPALVSSPPYDVISAEERARLISGSPFNIARLLLSDPGDESYQEASQLLRSWQKSGVLGPDDAPHLYRYEMRYEGADGEPRRAVGVLGALDLRPFGEGIVAHEETMAAVKADRMAILEATQANLDPIVVLSSSARLAALLVAPGAPKLQFEVDGVWHGLSTLDETTALLVASEVGGHGAAIADGHHRYTTALAYRGKRRADDGPGPWDAILAFVTPASGSGLEIRPTHRAFSTVHTSAELPLEPATPEPPTDPGAVVVVWGAAHHRTAERLVPNRDAIEVLPPPLRAAGAAVARELVYPALGVGEAAARYFSEADEALRWLEQYPSGAVILVAAVPEHEMAAAGEAGIVFPQKTTFFSPKPRAGLVMRLFAV